MERTTRRPLLTAVLMTCALALTPAGTASAAGCDNETLVPDGSNVVAVRAATHCLINQERAGAGRQPLAASATLDIPAQSFAEQMVRDEFFDHVSPTGSTVLTRVRSLSNYITKQTTQFAIGENLAWGTHALATPREIVQSWMESAGHRRNILDPRFRDIGIGVAAGAPEDVGGQPAGTYTSVFGQRTVSGAAPRAAKPAPRTRARQLRSSRARSARSRAR